MVDRLLAGEFPLRMWREYRGLPQSQLGEAAGITQSMVTMIERGDRHGTVDTLASIAHVLQVGLDDLTQSEAGWSGFFRRQEGDVQASYAMWDGISAILTQAHRRR